MNERFRALLDDAVSDLEPANPDPVPAIVGRGRAARRRAIGAGALAVALLAGGGVTAAVRLADRPEPTGTVAAQAPVPSVVGSNVVAGDLIVPVPKGWRVVVADPKVPCGELKKTVLISGSATAGCATAPIEVAGTTPVNWSGISAIKRHRIFTLPPVPYTLKGGAPAWLATTMTYESNDPTRRAGAAYWKTLVVPWSKVHVTMRVSEPEQQRLLDSMSVTPSPRAGRLVLQDTVVEANLSFSRVSDGADPEFGSVTDARRIAAVLSLLRAQRKTVDEAHACAGPDQPAAWLTLHEFPIPPSDWERPTAAGNTTVVISLGDCREAVSSNGGRVRLSQDTVDELIRLFGITGR